MGRTFLASLLLPLLVCSLDFHVGAAAPLSSRITNYSIEARLDPERRTVSGRQRIAWRNITTKPATELCFHLYLNAFANNRTTFLRAFPDAVKKWARNFPGEWGGIDVKSLSIEGTALTHQLEFVQPDDGNSYDRTVARLPLDEPVRPGEVAFVEIEFESRLPRVFARTGHAAPFFMVAQWFPKLGVFENGQWNCRQYHPTTEFYSDFGVYDVELTVPRSFVVGHSGTLIRERANRDGTKTLSVRGEDVHDFAWVADPRFRLVEERIGDITIRLLMQPGHVGQAGRQLHALRAAIERYEQWFGPYPYPVLTVVDPGPGALGAAGMEYPMLITTGTAWWMPKGVRIPELLAIHEFGHQYWYGMIANDEFESAWLDEGINSYVEGLIMDETYGERASYLDLLGLRLDSSAFRRMGYLARPSADPIMRPAYAMLDRRSYVSVTYSKTALLLQTTERLAGRERLLQALRAYAQRYRFRHPRPEDFLQVLAQKLPAETSRFFREVVESTGVLDYAVTRLDVHELAPLAGRGVELQREEEMRYRTEVVVSRLGEIRAPVDIIVVFEDGSQTRETWDGQDRWRRLEFLGTVRADHAVVDPEGKLVLDVNRLNNSRMRAGGTRGIVRLASRWGIWMQTALHFLTGF